MKRKPLLLASTVTALVCALAVLLAIGPAAAGTRGGVTFFNSSKRPIPDASQGGGVLSKISVRTSGRIANLDVGVRINHSFDADLNIYLVSPRGKFVELSTDNGGSGNDYGTGSNSCRGNFTIFDDRAGRSVRSAAAPFPGIYRPQTPLRALNGDSISGTWRLMVLDDDNGSTGTVGCFTIRAFLR
jgi:subtilisin-like proprotein convertase family protein